MKELQNLLGFVNYYRSFVPDFSKKLKPIYTLLKKDQKSTNKSKKINWTKEHQNIIEDILSFLQSPEVMAFPDFTKPFILHCDASDQGLGAVLLPK